MNLNNRYLLLFVFTVLFLESCNSQEQFISQEPIQRSGFELIVPAGVDSTTALEANQLANDSFVSITDEEKSDELKDAGSGYMKESDKIWNILNTPAKTDSTDSSSTADNPDFVENFNQGADYFIELRDMENQTQGPFDDKRYAELVDLAIQSFESAIVYNPFDAQTKLLLGQLYGVKASRLNREENYDTAIGLLEKLALIEKGDHIIYSVLAENYYLTKNYLKAAENFNVASKTFLDTIELTDYYFENGAMSQQDSTTLYTYYYYMGQSYTNLFDPLNATTSFLDAKKFSINSEQALSVDSELEYINWDDGNIQASAMREKVILMANNDQLAEAESGFNELLKIVNSPKASDEIQWRLGVVEYQLGKTESAADRLLKLVQRTEINDDGTPVDSKYSNYFNDFGIITYNIGLQQLSNKNRPLALTYLLQSSKVKWTLRARSHLRIADLLTNNIPEALKYAHLAESDVASLSDGDAKSLYRLLSELYRRSGNMNEARKYFAIWRGIS